MSVEFAFEIPVKNVKSKVKHLCVEQMQKTYQIICVSNSKHNWVVQNFYSVFRRIISAGIDHHTLSRG